MPFPLPSIPYPPSREGYWSPVTSTLNWCEEDYYATIYAAEIVNTLTNVVFVYLAYKGVSNCVRNGHDTVFVVAFFCYLIIGIASILFHASLKHTMQLFDELSMIYMMSTVFFAIFSLHQSKPMALLIFILTVSIAAFITSYYLYLGDPVFHQTMFALLTITVLSRSMYTMEQHLRPSRRAKNSVSQQSKKDGLAMPVCQTEQTRIDKRDFEILQQMWAMVRCGLIYLLLGFFLWNLDNIFCSTLRRWRQEIGLPWGILLEGHGWWHILTGLAAYYILTWSVWLRYCLKNTQDDVEVIWPSTFTSVPVVIRKDRVQPRVDTNKKLK